MTNPETAVRPTPPATPTRWTPCADAMPSLDVFGPHPRVLVALQYHQHPEWGWGVRFAELRFINGDRARPLWVSADKDLKSIETVAMGVTHWAPAPNDPSVGPQADAAPGALLTDETLIRVMRMTEVYGDDKPNDHLLRMGRAVLHAAAEPLSADRLREIRWLREALREAGHCIDGGKCHHGCGKHIAAECWRQKTCDPLTGSGLNDNWRLKGELRGGRP